MESGVRTLPQGADRKVLLGFINCLGPPHTQAAIGPHTASGPAGATRLPATHSTSGPTSDQPPQSPGPDLSSRVPSPTGEPAQEASSEKLSPREAPTRPEYPN